MDEEQNLPVWQLSEGELLGGLLASESAMRRQYARTLELIAEAESRGVVAGQGYRDTAALLAMALRISRKEAKARVAQTTTPMPLATKTLQAGDIGPDHVHEIQKVLAQAPATLPVEDRDQGETPWSSWHCAPTPSRCTGPGGDWWATGTSPRIPRTTRTLVRPGHGGSSATGSAWTGRCGSPENSTPKPPNNSPACSNPWPNPTLSTPTAIPIRAPPSSDRVTPWQTSSIWRPAPTTSPPPAGNAQW